MRIFEGLNMAEKVQLATNLEGEAFYASTIPEAQRDLEKAGLVAVPMYALARGFPHPEFYTSKLSVLNRNIFI